MGRADDGRAAVLSVDEINLVTLKKKRTIFALMVRFRFFNILA